MMEAMSKINDCNNGRGDYILIKEMEETSDVIRKFDPDVTIDVSRIIGEKRKLLLTGEGSSRIFPAKNCIRKSLTWGLDISIITEGARQAAEYRLDDYIVFCSSNSGRTREPVTIARELQKSGHKHVYGISANRGTPLEDAAVKTFCLNCGWEKAVAATKSVAEQALFYLSIAYHLGEKDMGVDLASLPELFDTTFNLDVSPDIIQSAVDAPVIYFAGYNDGVAEELTLKTNEITRKRADYLEGTYAAHGIEEVMSKEDVLFLIDPIKEEEETLYDILCRNLGMKVFSIADRETIFPTFRIPSAGALKEFVYLAAGWNLLVKIGLSLGINLDKPVRARKVGNSL
jgi:glutamine---fructose-6-phosphate transaminase (isomerizing)